MFIEEPGLLQGRKNSLCACIHADRAFLQKYFVLLVSCSDEVPFTRSLFYFNVETLLRSWNSYGNNILNEGVSSLVTSNNCNIVYKNKITNTSAYIDTSCMISMYPWPLLFSLGMFLFEGCFMLCFGYVSVLDRLVAQPLPYMLASDICSC
ncbi:hypothetical protein V6N13_111569 [Hibiscus sabdariffa]